MSRSFIDTVLKSLYFVELSTFGCNRRFMLTDDQDQPAVVWYADYYPFGEVMYESGEITVGNPATTGITWKPNFRFPGQYEDEETGMFYNRFRYYLPEVGKYNRIDPLKFPIYHNFNYKYAKNNPLIIYDALGLFVEKCTYDWRRYIHAVICVDNYCIGFSPSSPSAVIESIYKTTQGQVSLEAKSETSSCNKIPPPNCSKCNQNRFDKITRKVMREYEGKTMGYNLYFFNCYDFVELIISISSEQCCK